MSKLNTGRIFFEYDGNWELYVGVGEEIGGMVEGVQPDDWERLKDALDPRIPDILARLVYGDAHMMSPGDWKLVEQLIASRDEDEEE